MLCGLICNVLVVFCGEGLIEMIWGCFVCVVLWKVNQVVDVLVLFMCWVRELGVIFGVQMQELSLCRVGEMVVVLGVDVDDMIVSVVWLWLLDGWLMMFECFFYMEILGWCLFDVDFDQVLIMEYLVFVGYLIVVLQYVIDVVVVDEQDVVLLCVFCGMFILCFIWMLCDVDGWIFEVLEDCYLSEVVWFMVVVFGILMDGYYM